MKITNIYDKEMKDAFELLSDADQEDMFKNVVNGLIAVMSAYYYTKGSAREDVEEKLEIEINKLKGHLADRLNLASAQQEAFDAVLFSFDRTEKMDDSFVLDAKLDIHLLMEEVVKSKE
jgi:hypothetical protein